MQVKRLITQLKIAFHPTKLQYILHNLTWVLTFLLEDCSVILLLSSFTLVYIFLICIPHNNCIFTVAFWSRDWRLRLTLLVVLTMDDSIPINNVGTVPTLRYNDCHKTFKIHTILTPNYQNRYFTLVLRRRD